MTAGSKLNAAVTIYTAETCQRTIHMMLVLWISLLLYLRAATATSLALFSRDIFSDFPFLLMMAGEIGMELLLIQQELTTALSTCISYSFTYCCI